MIHFTDSKKLGKKEDTSEDASILCRQGNKITMEGKENEGSQWERVGEGKKWGKDQIWRKTEIKYWGRKKRSSQGQENQWKYSCAEGWAGVEVK